MIYVFSVIWMQLDKIVNLIQSSMFSNQISLETKLQFLMTLDILFVFSFAKDTSLIMQ